MSILRKVIDPKHLPTRLPTVPTVLVALILDRIAAPVWLWALIGFALMLWWALALKTMDEEVPVTPKELERPELASQKEFE